MTRMPGALWHPIPSFSPGNVTRPPMGQVTHTAVSPETTDALMGVVDYIANPVNQSSSYFVCGIDGTIVQCIDLDDEAWTQRSGNRAWIGVENVGDGTKEGLTQAQMEANARIFAWLHQTYPSIPLALTHNPLVGGLGYHGMGAPAWGHAVCPGYYVIGQLPTILAYAVALVNGIPPAPHQEDPNMSRMVAHDEAPGAAITLNDDAGHGGTVLVAMGCHPWDVDGKKVTAINGGQIFHFNPHEHCVEIVPDRAHNLIVCRMRQDSGGGDTFPTIRIAHGHVA